MNHLLLEFLSEEMPANMIESFANNLFNHILTTELKAQGINLIEEFKLYYTPRRIIANLQNFAITNSSLEEEIRGPRLDAPSQALEGFLRKYNLKDTASLTERDGFYFYTKKQEILPLNQAIKAAIEMALGKAIWPKSMRWGNHEIKWVRPLHSIVCLLNAETIPFQFGHLQASNLSLGHRFLSTGDIKLDSADFASYQQQMRDHHVIIAASERKKLILEQIAHIEQQKNLKLIADDELLDEVANLVEYPVVYCGEIAAQFMKLPPEVLILTLKKNQRYFMLQDQYNKLAPYFIIVSNIKGADNGETIIAGNQKVLRARLSDALFFYENDIKTTLASRAVKLKNITYHADIGSVAEKVKSVEQLATKLCAHLKMDDKKVMQTISLMKNDLVTDMVGEFPELQGVMGYYYALHDQESEEIAVAVKEHYKPLGPKDSIPSNEVGALVACAEKLDTIARLFAINIRPTGTKDPFALRRAANGVLRIIKDYQWQINLEQDLPKLGIDSSVIQFILERAVA